MARRAPDLYRHEDWHSFQDWFAAMAHELVSPGADPGPPVEEPEDSGPEDFDPNAMISVSNARGETLTFDDLPAETREHIMRFIAGDGEAVEEADEGDGEDGGEGEYTISFGWFGYGPFRSRRTLREVRPDRLPLDRQVSPLHRFLLRRCAEVLAALKAGTLPPVLLATPTGDTGHLDPAVFLTRLEAMEATGAEPMPADFQQALLRLPRTVDPEVAARAGRLTSEAGRRAARWLKDGPADPEAGARWRYSKGAHTYYADESRAPHGSHVSLVPQLSAEPTGLALVDELLGEASDRNWGEHGRYMTWWPAVLPSHRDVVAVNCLPHLFDSWGRPGVDPVCVEMLTAADGPAGEPLALLLASFLVRPDSAEGVRLLLLMAVRGDLPTAALGKQLVLLTGCTSARLAHAADALEQAARQGAHREVWRVIRAALPHALPGMEERPAPGLTDLIALGVQVARWAGASGEISEVTEAAARKGSSGFVRECRRLRDVLARS